jgi:hypothetical protein
MIALGELLVYCGLCYAGVTLAKQVRQPSIKRIIVIVCIVIAAQFIGKNIRFISIFEFVIYWQYGITAIGLGIIAQYSYQLIIRKWAATVK